MLAQFRESSLTSNSPTVSHQLLHCARLPVAMKWDRCGGVGCLPPSRAVLIQGLLCVVRYRQEPESRNSSVFGVRSSYQQKRTSGDRRRQPMPSILSRCVWVYGRESLRFKPPIFHSLLTIEIYYKMKLLIQTCVCSSLCEF